MLLAIKIKTWLIEVEVVACVVSVAIAAFILMVGHGMRHRKRKNVEGERFVALLEIPPVVSAETAVRALIVAESKEKG